MRRCEILMSFTISAACATAIRKCAHVNDVCCVRKPITRMDSMAPMELACVICVIKNHVRVSVVVETVIGAFITFKCHFQMEAGSPVEDAFVNTIVVG